MLIVKCEHRILKISGNVNPFRDKSEKWVEDDIFEKHDLSVTPEISIETYLLVTLSTNLLSP